MVTSESVTTTLNHCTLNISSDNKFNNIFNISYDALIYVYIVGPNPRTLDDFWLMVWQHDVNRIVMITKLVENGKVRATKIMYILCQALNEE